MEMKLSLRSAHKGEEGSPLRQSGIDRVIIVSNSGSIGGGSSKVAIETAKCLAGSTDIKVVLFCGMADSEDVDELSKCGIEVVSLDSAPYVERDGRFSAAINGIYDRRARKALEDVIGLGDADRTLVHFHSWLHYLSPSLFFAAAKLDARVCVTAHEYFSVCPNGGFFDFNRLEICERDAIGPGCLGCNCDKRSYFHKLHRCIRYAVQRVALRKSHASIFAISEFSKNVLEKHRVPDGVKGMLPNPILIARTNLSTCATVPCGFEKDSFYLFVGRLSPEKGAALLCDAAHVAGVKLVVVGDGPLCEELKARYPEVSFEGWKNFDEITGYYLAARAVVIPSLCYETSSLAVLEAKAIGSAPFVAPDRCAASEYVRDGVDGLVFESGDVDSLAIALSALEDDKELERLRMNGGMPGGHSLREYVKNLLECYAAC